MPSREEIVEWLKEAALIADFAIVMNTLSTDNPIKSVFHHRAARVENMRCATCRYYRPSDSWDDDCKKFDIFAQGPDFGCWNWEGKGE